jgi:hypothetical protein
MKTQNKQVITVFLLMLVAGISIWYLGSLPIEENRFAFDWRMFWQATHSFRIDYTGVLVFNPPWTLALLWVFTIFPLSASWAFFSFFTLSCLGLYIQRQNGVWKWSGTFFLLSVSYPVLRELADGNLEILLLAGILLVLWAVEKQSSLGLAAAIVLLSTKFQESWLLLIAIGILVLREWPKPKIWKAVLWLAAYITPFLVWKWQPWLIAVGKFPAEFSFNSSLLATLARLNVPVLLSMLFWFIIFVGTIWGTRHKGKGRIEAGLLITASMLLAPYSGNSVLVPFVIATEQALQKRILPGALLIGLYNIPYIFLSQIGFRVDWEYTYWCGALFLTWLIYLWMIRKGHLPEAATHV